MKASFPKVKEMENGMIHLEPPPGSDQVTLCGITDWIGCENGETGVTAAVTCMPCRAIANYCQAHRKMREPKRRTSPISSTERGCSHPNAKVWMYRDDDTYMICPDCNSKWVQEPSSTLSSPDRGGA